MKKYWIIFKNSIQSGMAYRFNFLLTFFTESLSFGVMAYLWFSIYRGGNHIGGYTLKQLIVYYALTKILQLFIGNMNVARKVGEIIRTGEFSNYLLRPINFLGRIFFDNFGATILSAIMIIPIFVIVLFFTKTSILNFLLIAYFFISILQAILITFIIFYIVGLLTFYFGYIFGLDFIMFSIVSFFSGAIIPLDILPPFFILLGNYLPFKYISFIPISIITGKISMSVLSTLIGFAWIFALYVVSRILYKFGIKKYEAYGS